MEWFERVRARREELGISQASLARKVGVSQALIGKLEVGSLKNSQFLLPILQALDMPEDDIRKFFTEIGRNFNISSQERKIYNISPRSVFELFHPTRDEEGNYICDARRHELIPCPAELSMVLGAHAVAIISEEMSPEYEAGDVAYINPLLPPLMNATGFFEKPGKDPNTTIRRLVRIVDLEIDAWIVKRWRGSSNDTATEKCMLDEWPYFRRCAFRGLRR